MQLQQWPQVACSMSWTTASCCSAPDLLPDADQPHRRGHELERHDHPLQLRSNASCTWPTRLCRTQIKLQRRAGKPLRTAACNACWCWAMADQRISLARGAASAGDDGSCATGRPVMLQPGQPPPRLRAALGPVVRASTMRLTLAEDRCTGEAVQPGRRHARDRARQNTWGWPRCVRRSAASARRPVRGQHPLNWCSRWRCCRRWWGACAN